MITCSICLDKPSDNKYGILKCKHQFCTSCIVDWAEVTNSCPVCRQEFSEIRFSDGKIKKVQAKKQRIDDEMNPEEYQDEADENCYICQYSTNEAELLICDMCNQKVCHVACDNALDGQIPEGDWICHYCRQDDTDDDQYLNDPDFSSEEELQFEEEAEEDDNIEEDSD